MEIKQEFAQLPERLRKRARIEGECIVWTGVRFKNGYGSLLLWSRREGRKLKTKRGLAHRLAWAAINGEIPSNMLICHHCDNPPCMRPSHLFLGTYRDNSHDMIAKGRQVKYDQAGENNPRAKITEREAIAALAAYHAEVERRHAAGLKRVPKGWITQQAELLGISRNTLTSLLQGRNWAHLRARQP